eukprot:TRINITY_DN22017_c0_g1_i1.p1 TRINITY_DN22017_c0_g1~~TRINITY_DN22017_c0_g1_i1.p1  ORF type:complete len:817 (+),score=206.80 TRINITY_DN22017_c0_g1_i1:124-2574(+)
MDAQALQAHRSDKSYEQEFGLPRIVSYEFGQIPLEKAQMLLDDPVEFRLVIREFWLIKGGSKGGLTREELGEVCVQIFEQLGEWEEWTHHPTPQQIDEVYRRTDVNKTGLIELDEFEAAARRVLSKIRASKGARMLSNQGKLKKLPIPSLADTCRRYRACLEPMLSANEMQRAGELLGELAGPKGQATHQALAEYAKGRYSYIEEFWAAMYGRCREPLPVFMSPGVLFLQSKRLSHNRPLFKAARFISQLVSIVDMIHLQLLDPDYVRGTPLCMWEYQFLFARTRIPQADGDYNIVTSPAAISELEYSRIQHVRRTPRQVMVMKKNRIFLLDMYHNDGTCLSTMEVLAELEKIDLMCQSNVLAPAVGALTANNRTQWAADREALKTASARNAELLSKIDGTVLSLSLDEITPDPTSSTALSWVLHGDGRNRWFDKSAQVYVARNGVAGMQFEHSACDAWGYIRVLVQLQRELHDETYDEFVRRIPAPIPRREDRVEEVVFDLTPPLQKSIASAEAAVDGVIARTAVRYLTFHRFGKDGIVKHNVSPDALVQAALCIAYYVTRGVLPNTYSAGGTKQYLHGRTECVRTMGTEMADFCKRYTRMYNIPLGWRSEVEHPATKPSWTDLVSGNRVLRRAIEVHVRRMVDAKFGQGCDRHLFALRCVAQQMPEGQAPAILTDPIFGKSMDFTLSTSNVPANPYALSQVFGPTSADGFGVCYSVYNGHMTFGITCFKDEDGESPIDHFRNALEHALNCLTTDVLTAIPLRDRMVAAVATRFMMLSFMMTTRFGWIAKLPVIGSIVRRLPIVGRLLTFKRPGA